MAAQDLATPAVPPADEEEAARALALRFGLEYVDVASFAPDPEILQSIPVDLMFRYNFLPYRRDENGRHVLVMADPTDIPVVDELALLLQTDIQPAVGTLSAIQEALKKGSGTQRVLEQAGEAFKIQIVREDEAGDEFLSTSSSPTSWTRSGSPARSRSRSPPRWRFRTSATRAGGARTASIGRPRWNSTSSTSRMLSSAAMAASGSALQAASILAQARASTTWRRPALAVASSGRSTSAAANCPSLSSSRCASSKDCPYPTCAS
jgi:hypothetical protein